MNTLPEPSTTYIHVYVPAFDHLTSIELGFFPETVALLEGGLRAQIADLFDNISCEDRQDEVGH